MVYGTDVVLTRLVIETEIGTRRDFWLAEGSGIWECAEF